MMNINELESQIEAQKTLIELLEKRIKQLQSEKKDEYQSKFYTLGERNGRHYVRRRKKYFGSQIAAGSQNLKSFKTKDKAIEFMQILDTELSAKISD